MRTTSGVERRSRAEVPLPRVAAGAVLCVVGIVAWLAWTRTPPEEMWWGAPAAALVPHLVALVAAGAGGRAGRAALVSCALLSILSTVGLLLAVGFGLWQVPATALLVATAFARTGPATPAPADGIPA